MSLLFYWDPNLLSMVLHLTMELVESPDLISLDTYLKIVIISLA